MLTVTGCPNCDGEHLYEETKTYSFHHGCSEVEVTHPVIFCKDCGYSFFDTRGYQERSNALKNHLWRILEVEL